MKKCSNVNQMEPNLNAEDDDVGFTRMMLETMFSMGVTHEYIIMELIAMVMKEKMPESPTLERDSEVWLRNLRSKVLEHADTDHLLTPIHRMFASVPLEFSVSCYPDTLVRYIR